MLETYSHEQLRDLVGHEVKDADGQMVGYVDLVFNDDRTGRPEWMGIWRGIGPFGHRHLVPLQGITHERDEIRLPWTKQQVHDAPSYDEKDDRSIFDDEPHFGISQETEDAAYRHYGLESPGGAEAGGARLRAWPHDRRAEDVVGSD